MQLVVTRLVALKSLLFLSGGASSFQLQPPPSPLIGFHNPQYSPSSGWNRPSSILSSSSKTTTSSEMTFATPDQVLQALKKDPNAVVLDVRTEDEIVQFGHVNVPGHRWVHTSCTPMECPLLSSTAGDSLLPDKQTQVIVYCASGKRAAKAKEVLDEKGYQLVLNAGAFKDLDYLK